MIRWQPAILKSFDELAHIETQVLMINQYLEDNFQYLALSYGYENTFRVLRYYNLNSWES